MAVCIDRLCDGCKVCCVPVHYLPGNPLGPGGPGGPGGPVGPGGPAPKLVRRTAVESAAICGIANKHSSLSLPFMSHQAILRGDLS